MSKPTVEELGAAIFAVIEEYYGKKKFKATDLIKLMKEKYGSDVVDKDDVKEAIRPMIDSGKLVYGYFLGSTIEIPHEEGASSQVDTSAPKQEAAEPAAAPAGGREVKSFSRAAFKMRGGGGSSTSGKKSSTNLRPSYVEKNPPCSMNCPAGENIREWLTDIREDNSFESAFYTLTNSNPFPSTMGRICPHPCETGCNRNAKDETVGINSVEGAIGDYAIANGLKLRVLVNEKNGKRVAVVGGGPSGLSAAYQLARRGYAVTVHEMHEKAGGMLRYGIPSYRLPDAVLDAEIQRIVDLGVEIKYNTRIGKDVRFDDLQKNFDAVYLAFGMHQGMKLGVPGENVEGVWTAAAFLNKINHGEKVAVGKRVIVVGAGDSAIDAARTSRRLGAEVTLVYRRSRGEMPAIKHEVGEAEAESVKYEFLCTPVSAEKTGAGLNVKLIRMELKDADASGRPKPVEIPGSEFVLECDTLIGALGQKPDFTGLEMFRNEKGWLTVDANGRTQIDKVWAGGDITAPIALATAAIGEGRRRALDIDNVLMNREAQPVKERKTVLAESMRLDHYEAKPMTRRKSIELAERMNRGFDEVVGQLSLEEAKYEADRCMSCGMCFDCEKCYLYCQDQAINKLPKGQHYAFNLPKCTGCKKCFEECPCGFIDMN
ncbi:MAG: FAD-dependent oxidoreductase [Nitrospinae bacterium]|nr:FAD-dependent oxidoreductase [Nitrospinota bacterium]